MVNYDVTFASSIILYSVVASYGQVLIGILIQSMFQPSRVDRVDCTSSAVPCLLHSVLFIAKDSYCKFHLLL